MFLQYCTRFVFVYIFFLVSKSNLIGCYNCMDKREDIKEQDVIDAVTSSQTRA